MSRIQLLSAINRQWPNAKYYANVDGINLPFFVNSAVRHLWINKIQESPDTELIRKAAQLLDNPGFIKFSDELTK